MGNWLKKSTIGNVLGKPIKVREKCLDECQSDKFNFFYDRGEIKKIILLDFAEYNLFKQKLELELQLYLSVWEDC